MSDITVYGIPGSPFLRAVEVSLKEKGADYRLQPMSPAEMKTPEHLKLHAFGRIPIFEHGDFRLYETQAIIRYLDEIFIHPPLTPGNPSHHHLSRTLWPERMDRIPPIDPVEHVGELRGRDCDRAAGYGWPDEAAPPPTSWRTATCQGHHARGF